MRKPAASDEGLRAVHSMNRPARRRARSAAALCLLLAGCGGGGGGAPQAGMTPPPPPPPCTMTLVQDGRCLTAAEFTAARDALAQRKREAGEYDLQTLFNAVGMPQAHAALELLHGAQAQPGAGSKVAYFDTGLHESHAAFDGVAITNRTPPGPGYAPEHGTAIGSVISAAKGVYVDLGRTFPDGYLGAAPGAEIDFYLHSDTDPERTLAAHARKAMAAGTHFISISIGGGDMVSNYAAGEYPERVANRINADFRDALAQRGAVNPAVIAMAAGNRNEQPCTPQAGDDRSENRPNCLTLAEFQTRTGSRCISASPEDGQTHCVHAPEPQYGAGMTLLYPELRDRLVAVVSVVGDDPGIALSSNRCGLAADWCIAAPGRLIAATGTGTELREVRGTSYAAPLAAAGLALMRQYFRGQMSSPDLLARLYATANKTGKYSNRAVYGQGLMDLAAALRPVGTSTVSTRTVDAALHRTRLALGSAFGDGMARSLAGKELLALDALGAPFWHDASSLVQGASQPSGAQRLQELWDVDLDDAASSARRPLSVLASSPWRLALHAPIVPTRASLLNVAGAASSLTYAPGRWSLAAYTTAGRAGQRARPEHGALLAYRPRQSGLGLRLGVLRETRGVLGSDSRGAFGRVSAHSAALGFEWSGRAFGWGLAADVELGVVDGRSTGGLIEGLSGLATSTAQLRAHRRLGGRDSVLLSLSQPLRLERGQARLRLPVARGLDGAVAERATTARLAPSGRQLDLAVYWQRRGVLGGALRAGAVVSRHPGHAAGALEAGVQLGFRRAF